MFNLSYESKKKIFDHDSRVCLDFWQFTVYSCIANLQSQDNFPLCNSILVKRNRYELKYSKILREYFITINTVRLSWCIIGYPFEQWCADHKEVRKVHTRGLQWLKGGPEILYFLINDRNVFFLYFLLQVHTYKSSV